MGWEYFAPEATRPLALVNCDNRIVAAAAKRRWERTFAAYVHPSQRGFLPGRSILQNVIDVDDAAMTISLRHASGAIVLFDFRAAFPSLSTSFLQCALELMGVPLEARRLVRALYHDQHCRISLAGETFDGFRITSGIRQGCPLSPLLFAAVTDLLLRILARRLPQLLTRAFADDTAAVSDAFPSDADAIMDIFHTYGEMSGLRLNLAKTIVIPLTLEDPAAWGERFLLTHPAWTGVRFAH